MIGSLKNRWPSGWTPGTSWEKNASFIRALNREAKLFDQMVELGTRAIQQ